MKAAVLAGGPGTALLPIANLLPKLAFPVANEPLVRHLTRFFQANSIGDVAVVGNSRLEEPGMRQWLRAAAEPGSRLSFYTDPQPRGTAGSLGLLRDDLEGAPLVAVEGGILINGLDLTEMVDAHRRRGAGLTLLVGMGQSTDPHGEVLSIDPDDRILDLRILPEKPHGRGSLQSLGIYVIDPEVLQTLPDSGYVDIKEQLLPFLVERDVPVYGWRSDAYVRKIGHVSDYFQVNRELLFGRGVPRNGQFGRQIARDVWAGPGADIAGDVEFHGPVLLGENCRIDRGARVIGPTSVGADVCIGRNAAVSESILWANSQVKDRACLEKSLVGHGCVVPCYKRLENSVLVRSEEYPAGVPLLSRITRADSCTLIQKRGDLTCTSHRTAGQQLAAKLKRFMDVAIASLGLLVSAPLFALIAAAIKLDSAGPVFFRQRRCGFKGREFVMYKFRTMRHNAESMQKELVARKNVDGPTFKIFGDPRITRIGRILRRTSLDELPQLMNVLKGEMSLVGPRPLVFEEMRCAPSWRDLRLQVKPGLTGLWQVMGRGSTGFDEWVKCDTNYVKHQSLLLDLKILFLTVMVVIRGVGAE